MATQLLAKGPLSSALGQWMFLGFGTFMIFTGDNGVSTAAKEIASLAFRLATGRDGLSGAMLMREAALNNQSALYNSANGQSQQQQPIVIHSVSNSSSKGWTAAIVQLGLGAGACWGVYLVFSNFLPEQIKEMMPVTRKFFETAVTSLGEGILRVREVLSEQIAALGIKQDEMSAKQDLTHSQVLGVRDDVGDVRRHVDDVASAISRCENSLGDAAGRQAYMSSGVRLLVQSVGDMLRPSNPAAAAELDQFSRMSAELMGDDVHFKESSNSSTDKKHRGQLEYPASPNLSEIGSTTSNMVEFSLPRSSHSVVTPSSSSSNGAAYPGSMSKATGRNNMMNHPPPSLLGIPSPPIALKMLQSFGSRNGGSYSTATTVSSRSSSMSSENEVPWSKYPDKGRVTPSGASNASNSERVKNMDVDELLRIVRSGGTSIQA